MTKVLPVPLHLCETWSLTLFDEEKFRNFRGQRIEDNLQEVYKIRIARNGGEGKDEVHDLYDRPDSRRLRRGENSF